MLERGLHVDHTTIYRWVQHYAPELEKRCQPHINVTTDSWRVDETSMKVKKHWAYLYRAVDSAGNTLDFVLSPTRDGHAATQFFLKALAASHTKVGLQNPSITSSGSPIAGTPIALPHLKTASLTSLRISWRKKR